MFDQLSKHAIMTNMKLSRIRTPPRVTMAGQGMMRLHDGAWGMFDGSMVDLNPCFQLMKPHKQKISKVVTLKNTTFFSEIRRIILKNTVDQLWEKLINQLRLVKKRQEHTDSQHLSNPGNACVLWKKIH